MPPRPPLVELVLDSGFTPRHGDAEALLELLGSDDERLARGAERALAQLGGLAVERVALLLPGAASTIRPRLVRLVGRAARHLPPEDERALQLLRVALDDADGRSRRAAVVALGKLRAPWLEEALLARWAVEAELPELRALAAALGKVGGTASFAALRGAATDDAELRRLVEEARLKLERTLAREVQTRIDPRRAPPGPIDVLLRCRAGLERLLVDELPQALAPEATGEGRVRVRLAAPLEVLFGARTMLRFALPLPALRLDPEADDAVEVARAVAAPTALATLRAFTEGPIRVRVEWSGAGHRRAATYRFARELERLSPELINDPTRSAWEVIVGHGGRGARALQLELWPRGLPDPRFTYRRRDVPAASHPTVAAALARVAGVRPDDVVWDPFVGSATELIERALLGPYDALYGTDLAEEALAAARENVAAAGIERCELARSDARGRPPPRAPTLILTNPPMGKRVLQAREVLPLYSECLRHFAALLAPRGRLVWISPFFGKTVAIAREHGLRATMRQRLDMGGFAAEIQVLVKP